MAHEYSVNNADLIAVADAIRTKGETTEALVFPAGFVEAIEGIKGGGGVNAKAYASEDALPSSAADGDIAVISTTAVGEVYAQSAEPDEPATGDLWIVFEVEGARPSIVGNVTIYPKKAYQYVNNAWSEVPILIWANGKWNTALEELIVLRDGVIAPEAGSYKNVTSTSFANGKINSASINSENGNYGYFSTKVNVDKYNTLKVHVDLKNILGAGYSFTFGLSSSAITSGDYSSQTNKLVAKRTVDTLGEQWASVDVSHLSGAYYISIVTLASFTIDEILLTEAAS